MPKDLFSTVSPTQSTVVWLSWLRLGFVLVVLTLGINSDTDMYHWLVLFGYSGLAFLFVYQKEVLCEQKKIALSLLFDILFIGWFLYGNEGVMSGWVSVLLFPALVGSLTCARRTAWLIAVLAMLCYGLLIYLHLDEMASGAMDHAGHTSNIADIDQGEDWTEHPGASMASHIEGMLVTFCISVAVLTGFISHQASLIRRHQKLMTGMRERQLREQQIMAFATLSANTTHRLASPISTVSMLLEELAESNPEKDWHNDVLYQEIQKQIGRCENVLQTLVKTTRDYDPDKLRHSTVNAWLPVIVGNWWVTRNEVQYQLDVEEALQKQTIEYNDNVSFALINLLDNAANACKEQLAPLIDIQARIDESKVMLITIQDNGEGVEQSTLVKLGQQFVKSGTGGMGIGATLAQAAIQQSGGSISMGSGDVIDGVKMGTKVTITLPLVNDSRSSDNIV